MVHSRLELIKDWQVLAHAAGYCATILAAKCCVSKRQLERFFQARMSCSPHKWLRKKRMERAGVSVLQGVPFKQISADLGYKTAAHFCHDFRDYFGVSPSQYLSQAVAAIQPIVDVAFWQ